MNHGVSIAEKNAVITILDHCPKLGFTRAQRLLRLLALDDILKDCHDFAGWEFIDIVFIPAGQLVILVQRHGMICRFTGLPNLPKHLNQAKLLGTGTNFEDALADQPFSLIVINLFPGAVEFLENKVLAIANDFIHCHTVVDVFKQFPVTFLVLPQRLFRLLARGDVAGDAD